MVADIEYRRDEQACHDDHEEAITDPELFKVRENEDECEKKNEKEHGFMVVDRFQSFVKQIRCHQILPCSSGAFYPNEYIHSAYRG